MAKYPRGLRVAILNRDGYQCSYCGTSVRANPNIDHITPRSAGGKTHPENLRLSCGRCNTSKGTKTTEEYLAFARRKLAVARKEFEYRRSVVKHLEALNGKA